MLEEIKLFKTFESLEKLKSCKICLNYTFLKVLKTRAVFVGLKAMCTFIESSFGCTNG